MTKRRSNLLNDYMDLDEAQAIRRETRFDDDDLGGIPSANEYTGHSFVPVERVDDLGQLDLRKQLLDRYYDLVDQQSKNASAPLNQQAQVGSTLVSTLNTIIKLQEQVNNIERLKVLEQTLIAVLKKHPAILDEFLADYKQALKDAE